jgi:hypothetical protein
MKDDRAPWWAYYPQLIEIRRHTLEEFNRELDQRKPVPTAPDPVVADILSGARLRELAQARNDVDHARYQYAVRAGGSRRRTLVGQRSAGRSECRSSCCTAGTTGA